MRVPIQAFMITASAAFGMVLPQGALAGPPAHAKAHGHDKHHRVEVHFHDGLRCGTDHSARAQFHREREEAARALYRAARYASHSRSCEARVGPQLSHLTRYARLLDSDPAIERAQDRIRRTTYSAERNCSPQVKHALRDAHMHLERAQRSVFAVAPLPRTMPDGELAWVLRRLESTPSPYRRAELAERLLGHERLRASQLARVLHRFDGSYYRLRLVRSLAPSVVDPQGAGVIAAAFPSSYYRREAMEEFRGHRVPTPPAYAARR